MYISKTSRPIAIIFNVMHHWGRGKVALCFGPDRIRTLVSMAINSSHRVIMRTCMDARKSSKFGQIRPSTTELAAIERLENPYRLIMEKRCCHFYSAVFDQILFILTGTNDIHESLDEFEIRPDLPLEYRVSCPLESKNRCCHFFSVTIYPIHFKCVGIEDMQNILEELKIPQNRTTKYVHLKVPHRLIILKMVSQCTFMMIRSF